MNFLAPYFDSLTKHRCRFSPAFQDFLLVSLCPAFTSDTCAGKVDDHRPARKRCRINPVLIRIPQECSYCSCAGTPAEVGHVMATLAQQRRQLLTDESGSTRNKN